MYFKKNYFDIKNLSVLHYNHKQRFASEYEEKKIQKFITWLWISFIWSSYNNYFWISENNLRKWRKKFFNSYISLYPNKEVVFISWHHLDDRIETTIMNEKRWAWVRWKRNMSIFKRSYIREKWSTFLQYVYFRPLINISKNKIREIGYNYNFKIFEDHTNMDEKISLRNKIRKNNLLDASPQYYNRWIKYYNDIQIDPILYLKKSQIEYIKLSNFHPKIHNYYRIFNINTIDSFQQLLDFLWIYSWISKNFLTEMEKFLQSNKWYKYFKWWYFFRSHWYLYVIEAQKKFRENSFSFKLVKKHSASQIRKNKVWDVFRWKRYRKFLINQKIPFFLRNYMPVEIVGKKVVNTLFLKDLQNRWYL